MAQLSVADIAKKAFDGVAAKLTGVIHAVTLSHTDSNPVYNATTGAVTVGAPVTSPGRAVQETENAIKANFPHFVITGAERVLFLEGLTFAPVQGDIVSSPTMRSGKVVAVQDLLAAGDAYRVIVI